MQYQDKKYAGFYNVGPDDARLYYRPGSVGGSVCARNGAKDMKWVNRYDGGPHEANFLKLDCSKIKRSFRMETALGSWKTAVEKTSRVVEGICSTKGDDTKACMDSTD